MSTSLHDTVDNPLYVNWVKAGLALLVTKRGIERFVENEITSFHGRVYRDVCTTQRLPLGTVCGICTTQNVLRCRTNGVCNQRGLCRYHDASDALLRSTVCPNGICEEIRKEILRKHRYNGPSWKNTDARKWGSNPWEFAKCYLTADGYGHVTSASNTDLAGLLCVIINHKHFQNIIHEDLSQRGNIFAEAKQFRNAIFHSGQNEVPDVDLHTYIDHLIKILSDPTRLASDAHAQDAVVKLQEIRGSAFHVSPEDIRQVKHEAIQAINQCSQDAVDAVRTEGITTKETIQNEGREHVRLIGDTTQTAVNAVKSQTQHSLNAVQVAGNHQTDRLERLLFHGTHNEEQLKAERKENLRLDLMKLYAKYYVRIAENPLHPEDNVVDIDDIFVKPCLKRTYLHVGDTPAPENTATDAIDSYRDIFHNKDGMPCKDIYVCGDAGMGKSSLCLKLISIWYHAHSKAAKNTELSPDEHHMRKFDFVFYIALRNATAENDIEDMIKRHLLKNPIHQGTISTVLQTDSEKCLIILNGLDEWSPPESSEQSSQVLTKGLPDRIIPSNCTILTTTRDWKLEELRLKATDIDQHITMSGLESGSSTELVHLVVKYLNMKYGRGLSPKDFEYELNRKNIDQLSTIPLLLKQMVWLWYKGKGIGVSQCEIYSGMLNLLFELAEMENERLTNNDDIKIMKREWKNSQIKLPQSFDGKQKCYQYRPLLFSLSRLAFIALFNDKNETLLVFESENPEQLGLSETEIDICLKVGILSQSKVVAGATPGMKRLSFLHTTFQEFLCAVYISISSENLDSNINKIFTVCSSVKGLLKMSNVFVFISGLNDEIASTLSDYIEKVVSDKEFMKEYFNEQRSLHRFTDSFPEEILQDMLSKCILESSNNAKENTRQKLDDIFHHFKREENKSMLTLQSMLQANLPEIKSVQLSEIPSSDLIIMPNDMRDVLMQTGFRQKVTIHERQAGAHTATINTMVCRVENKLISTELESSYCNTTQPKEFQTTLSKLSKLTSIDLQGLKLAHCQLEYLMQYLKNAMQLIEIHLSYLRCSDCSSICLNHLDLSQHTKLNVICISLSYIDIVHLNASELKEFTMLGAYGPNMSVTRLLQNAPKLRRFNFGAVELDTEPLISTVQTLLNVREISIDEVTFGASVLKLPPSMKYLTHVKLAYVSMSNKALRSLLSDIEAMTQIVNVKIEILDIKPAKTASSILKYITTSPTFDVKHGSEKQRTHGSISIDFSVSKKRINRSLIRRLLYNTAVDVVKRMVS